MKLHVIMFNIFNNSKRIIILILQQTTIAVKIKENHQCKKVQLIIHQIWKVAIGRFWLLYWGFLFHLRRNIV